MTVNGNKDIRQIIDHQGRRHVWIAEQLGISPSYLTRLLNGERNWPPELKTGIAAILGIPESQLFCLESMQDVA